MKTLILSLLVSTQAFAVGAFDDDNLAVLSECQDKAVAALTAFASVEPAAQSVVAYSLSKPTWPWYSLKDTDTLSAGEGEQVMAHTFVFTNDETIEVEMKFEKEGCILRTIELTIGE